MFAFCVARMSSLCARFVVFAPLRGCHQSCRSLSLPFSTCSGEIKWKKSKRTEIDSFCHWSHSFETKQWVWSIDMADCMTWYEMRLTLSSTSQYTIYFVAIGGRHWFGIGKLEFHVRNAYKCVFARGVSVWLWLEDCSHVGSNRWLSKSDCCRTPHRPWILCARHSQSRWW